jgi:hypothetical protein
MNRIATVLAALITMGTVANATTLASGASFGGPTQNNAICYIFNAGSSPVTIVGTVEIISQFSGVLPLSFNGCGTNRALASGAICNVNANIANNNPHACKVVITPDGGLVRGNLSIRAGSTVLQITDFR